MSAGEIVDLREIVAQDLRSADEGAKAAFLAEFGKEQDAFTDHTVNALAIWTDFRDTIDDNDQRRLPVAAIAFTAINHHISSYKLSMSGYTVLSHFLGPFGRSLQTRYCAPRTHLSSPILSRRRPIHAPGPAP
jgi:hypothetical protein